MDSDERIICLCPACHNRFHFAGDKLKESLDTEIKLEGGVSHYLEEVEELRLLLKSILKKELLDSLLSLYKVLNKEPRQSEMFSWFTRNSQHGRECRYAQRALNSFKTERLSLLKKYLRKCLTELETLDV